jgi:replicative DNA helicase
MNMPYKRIAKGFTTYALYPNTYNNDQIVEENGENKDYYQSIFEYKDHHYNKYIKFLQSACKFLNLKYDEKKKLDLTGKALHKLKQMSKEGNNQATEIMEGLSVSGTQDVETRKIVFDFDSDGDIDAARKDSIETVYRLMDMGLGSESVEVCFSGNKGFSVEVSLDQYITQPEFESIIFKVAGDLKTFDHKIKDPQRLFRMPLTKHNSSGLYKIPLTIEQLEKFSVKQILKEAQSLKGEHWDIIDGWKKNNKLPDVLKNIKPEKKKEEKVQTIEAMESDVDFSKKPPWMSEARFMLQEGYFKKGNRNEAFMILGTTYKLAGFDATQTFYLLEAVAEKQAFRNNEDRKASQDIRKEIIDVIFSANWKGGIYSEEDNTLLKGLIDTYGLKRYADSGYTLDDMHRRFEDFAKNIDKNTIKTGIKPIDDDVLITTGMLVSLLGSASAGKSTVCLNFLRNISKNGEDAVFFSLDMPDNLIYSRLIQMFSDTPKSLKQLLHDVKNGNVEELEQAFEKMKEEFGNVSFETKSGTSIEDIRAKLDYLVNTKGKNPKLIVVDYLEKVHGPYSDPTQRTGYVASALADIARDFNCCVLLLVQPQKSAGDPSEPLLSYRKIKGASIIEQDSRIVLSLWRPGFDPQDSSKDRFMSLAVLKNNMGTIGQYDFKWNGPNGSIDELSVFERSELESIIEEKEAKKKQDKDIF